MWNPYLQEILLMMLHWWREGQGRSTDAQKGVTKIVTELLLVARDEIMGENCYKFVGTSETEVGREDKCLSRKGGQVWEHIVQNGCNASVLEHFHRLASQTHR